MSARRRAYRASRSSTLRRSNSSLSRMTPSEYRRPLRTWSFVAIVVRRSENVGDEFDALLLRGRHRAGADPRSAPLVGTWPSPLRRAVSPRTGLRAAVDDRGVTHLSSEKPPGRQGRADRASPGRRSAPAAAPVDRRGGQARRGARLPAQIAQREELLGSLRTREGVVALEALERKTSGAEPMDADRARRLKQTAEARTAARIPCAGASRRRWCRAAGRQQPGMRRGERSAGRHDGARAAANREQLAHRAGVRGRALHLAVR